MIANLSLTYTYKTVLQKVHQLAKRHQKKIVDWPDAGYRSIYSLDVWMYLNRSEQKNHRAKDFKHSPFVLKFGSKQVDDATVDTFK